MNRPKPGALFIQAWASELAGVTRKPSWMARKAKSTCPPVPSAAPPPAPAGQAIESPEELPVMAPPGPPPSAAVDLSTSIALAQLAEENAALRVQITEMAATMARLRREVLTASEAELVKLSLTVAERVVGRELASDPALVVAWAREAVESLAAKDGVVIAVARDVRDSVSIDAWQEVGVEHRVKTDPQLAPGVVEVRTPEGTVATGAGARLSAIAQALGVEES
jgi:Flagellar assembly protein FliH